VAGVAAAAPDFVVVGTPRSGTTLLQRVLSELPDVRIPPETHFFSEFVGGLARNHRFPVEGPELRAVLDAYGSRPYLRGVDFDPAAVADALGGRCRSPIELFGAIVTHLAGHDAGALIGEKTPMHLLWWEPLARVLPSLRFVVVVRDPRAVAASFRAVGWGGPPVLTGQRWNADVRVANRLLATLGPDRSLLLQYEEVVTAPDVARERVKAFLGATGTATGAERRGVLFPAWESWKARALEPVDRDRLLGWQTTLTPAEQRAVVAVCRRGMAAFGYGPVPSRGAALLEQARSSPSMQLRRVRRRVRRWRAEREASAIGRNWNALVVDPAVDVAGGRPPD
jgi:hypothetical protein